MILIPITITSSYMTLITAEISLFGQMLSVPTRWDDPIDIQILLLANILDPWPAGP